MEKLFYRMSVSVCVSQFEYLNIIGEKYSIEEDLFLRKPLMYHSHEDLVPFFFQIYVRRIFSFFLCYFRFHCSHPLTVSECIVSKVVCVCVWEFALRPNTIDLRSNLFYYVKATCKQAKRDEKVVCRMWEAKKTFYRCNFFCVCVFVCR
jgi:hypothetical protein